MGEIIRGGDVGSQISSTINSMTPTGGTLEIDGILTVDDIKLPDLFQLAGALDNLIDVWFYSDEYSDVGTPSGNPIEFSNGTALTGVIGNTIVFPYDLAAYTLVYKGSGTLTKSGDTLTWSADGTIWDITLTSDLQVIDIGCLEGSGTIVYDKSGTHSQGYFSAGTWGNQAVAYGSLNNNNQIEGFYRI